MIRWQKVSSDGGLSSMETIRLATYQIPLTESGNLYKSEVSSENGTETVGYYKTEIDAENGHNALCKELGLKQ